MNADGEHQAQEGQRQQRRPHEQRDPPRAPVDFSTGLDGDVVRAVGGQRHQRHHPNQNRVPVQNSGLRADGVGPERLEEVAVAVQRHAAHDVAERRAEEDRQQHAGEEEDHIPEARQTGLCMWARNSMAMPRSISSQSTIISGR